MNAARCLFPPALLLATVLAGCAAPAPAPERDRGRERILERQKMMWYFDAEYSFVWDPEVTAVVTRIGRSVSRAVGASDNDFHYYVIDQPSVNAFTTPRGDIFIFSGLLSGMESSSELAGVLAHEMAHVRADHFARLQRQATVSSIPGLMAAILTRGDPRVIASTIAAAQTYQLHWSREMELESDQLAIGYLRATDYDPAGLLGAMRVIEKGQRLLPAGTPEGLMTHPVTSSRVAMIEAAMARAPGEPYRASADPQWERMRAVLRALTDRSSVVVRQYRRLVPGEGGAGHDHLGLIYARQGNYPEAEAEFRKALETDPGNRSYLSDLGMALFHQGKMAEARVVLQESLRSSGEEGYSYPAYYLGEIHREAGESESGYRYYRRAAASWPPLSEAHYQLGLILVERKELGEADFHFGKAARLRGDFGGALRSFTRAEARLGSDPVWASRIAAELWGMQ